MGRVVPAICKTVKVIKWLINVPRKVAINIARRGTCQILCRRIKAIATPNGYVTKPTQNGNPDTIPTINPAIIPHRQAVCTRFCNAQAITAINTRSADPCRRGKWLKIVVCRIKSAPKIGIARRVDMVLKVCYNQAEFNEKLRERAGLERVARYR